MGMMVSPHSFGGITYSYRTTVTSGTDTNSYSFASTDIGDAAANRYVVVAIGTRDNDNPAPTSSTVTIGGISATKLVEATVYDGGTVTASQVAIWIAAVPTGTTATIVVTMNETVLRMAVSVYAVYGLTAPTSPFDTTTTITDDDPSVVDINTTPGCLVIACGVAAASAGTQSATWTGATEDADVNPEVATTGFTAASFQADNVETPRAVSIDWAVSPGATSATAACSVALV